MPIRKLFTTAVRLFVLEVIIALSCLTMACSGASFDVPFTDDYADTSSDVASDGALLAVEVTDDAANETAAPDASARDTTSGLMDSATIDSAPVKDVGTMVDTVPPSDAGEACEILPTKGAPHCSSGQTCDLDDKGKPYCRTADLSAAPGKCAFNEECNANETCFYAAGATSGTCMLFCRSDADCCVGGPCSGSYSCKKSPVLYTSAVTGATYGVCRS